MAGLLKPTAFWFHSEEVPCQACKGISVCVKVILNKNNVSIKKKKVSFLVHKQVSKAFCCKLGILGFLKISPKMKILKVCGLSSAQTTSLLILEMRLMIILLKAA